MKTLIWKQRQIAGIKHFEARDSFGAQLFCAQVYSSGKIQLYSIGIKVPKNNSMYVFPSIKILKATCEEALTNPDVLIPYFDHEWADLSKRSSEVIAKADALIKKLTDNGKRENK